MKLKWLFMLSLVVCLFLSWKLLYGTEREHSQVEPSSMEIKMRNIGHLLLLHAGDSSSRVLPIVRTTKNSFQIQFESSFTIEPDTLVSIVNSNLNSSRFPTGYLVNVYECNSEQVVYGFEIQQSHTEEVVPCLGRSLPKACYKISVTFNRQPQSYSYLIISLLTCFTLGYFVLRKSNPRTETGISDDPGFIQIGDFQFYFDQQKLKLRDEEVLLTAKENQVLRIFGKSPNTIIERKTLQAEVWEKEGVLVGRSLDVFISKLRKKLEADPRVKIVNIHGKGYKLEIA